MEGDAVPRGRSLSGFDTVDEAIAAIRSGSMVVVLDDADRENEADLIFAAEFASEQSVAFVLQHTSGLICAAMSPERQRMLGLPPMVERNSDQMGTAFLVSVDVADATSTGISAADRAATLRALADPSTKPSRLNRPGHVFPLRAREGGVLERRGHTEAAVDLCRLAGTAPVGMICELVDEDKRGMLSGQSAIDFARAHGYPVITIDDLVKTRLAGAVERTASACVPLRGRPFHGISYASVLDSRIEHLAVVHGSVSDLRSVPLRIHSECLTGDVLGSQRCDCGPQLSKSLDEIVARGHGILIYLRGHEGRGVGLAAKLRAYHLQDSDGLDTVDANLAQGLPVDAREYAAAASIINDLGIVSVDLLSNNPDKVRALVEAGITVDRCTPLIAGVSEHNVQYMQTKATRMGHELTAHDLLVGLDRV
ncbi:3,4-dihydroxy-2-butanone-4-phosphate synthase [Rhodococcus fascians]|nr:3,4-dihydroxy-2-butanone-4-phosphate synthase [Rhodococcus fascians]MBY3999462.1 3,4-dihydroxy-2-butanone-4-phosphate synthase [Rhodococcus fascians]MBY4004995.1 3,4-dihydroxy-2-butanone-4-phosphate synthase [Rhodococcus fascians]MBY4010132.1 3,4-dihydroxy-2-butanone-4-phosphate synthase [Rhodococcus fascians]MBY4020202.1 3,4-dihydroxy-2-butanone-4-phosphate synthase [Rhodococcus fascians]